MLFSKCVFSFLVLCFVDKTLCKPTENNSEGRGIGSSIWGWITYPFSWWSSKEEDQMPINDHLTASTTYGPYDNIEIGKHNVTVWCNDQTCTTMKCDKNGCSNNTCNIYDTDMAGECREYNTIVNPEEPIPPQPTASADSVSKRPEQNENTQSLANKNETPSKVTDNTERPTDAPQAVSDSNITEEKPERPLQLEAVLSSSVTESKTSA